MSPAGLKACITLVNLTEAVTGTSSKAVESLNLSKTKTKFAFQQRLGTNVHKYQHCRAAAARADFVGEIPRRDSVGRLWFFWISGQ